MHDGRSLDVAIDAPTQDAPASDVSQNDVMNMPDAPDGGCQPELPDASIVVGTSTIAPTEDSIGTGATEAFPFVASRAACLTTFNIYVPDTNAPGLFGVYDDKGGPNHLLATAAIASPILGWNSATLSAPVTVVASQTVWLTVGTSVGASDSGATWFYQDTSNTGSIAVFGGVNVDDAGVATLPSVFMPQSSPLDAPISAYLR